MFSPHPLYGKTGLGSISGPSASSVGTGTSAGLFNFPEVVLSSVKWGEMWSLLKRYDKD